MNLHKQKAVRELGIPEEMYDEIFKVFVDETAPVLVKLRAQISSQDMEGISGTAHFIKGSSSSLRLDKIYSLSKTLEAQVKERKGILEIEKTFRELQAAFEEAKTAGSEK